MYFKHAPIISNVVAVNKYLEASRWSFTDNSRFFLNHIPGTQTKILSVCVCAACVWWFRWMGIIHLSAYVCVCVWRVCVMRACLCCTARRNVVYPYNLEPPLPPFLLAAVCRRQTLTHTHSAQYSTWTLAPHMHPLFRMDVWMCLRVCEIAERTDARWVSVLVLRLRDDEHCCDGFWHGWHIYVVGWRFNAPWLLCVLGVTTPVWMKPTINCILRHWTCIHIALMLFFSISALLISLLHPEQEVCVWLFFIIVVMWKDGMTYY